MANSVFLARATIQNYAKSHLNALLDVNNKAKICGLSDNAVILELPSGKKHYVPYDEVIRADRFVQHSPAASTVDLRDGSPELGIPPIYSNSYARMLARLVRLAEEEFRLPEEVSTGRCYSEGKITRIEVNRYERDPRARRDCIAEHGTTCCICTENLAVKYGEVEGLIHVHHLALLSAVDDDYQVDPINDLIPVCPNCHAVIHRRDPPYSIEESAFPKCRQGISSQFYPKILNPALPWPIYLPPLMV